MTIKISEHVRAAMTEATKGTDVLTHVLGDRYDAESFAAELSAEADVTVEAIAAILAALARMGIQLADSNQLAPEYALQSKFARTEQGLRPWGLTRSLDNITAHHAAFRNRANIVKRRATAWEKL